MEVEEDSVSVFGVEYPVRYFRRPFREGLEVEVDLPDGEILRLPERGLGKAALRELLVSELELRFAKG